MKARFKILPLFFLFGCWFISCNKSKDEKEKFIVDLPDTLILGKQTSNPINVATAKNCQIVVSNSWGNYIVFPKKVNKKWYFVITDSIVQNAGITDLRVVCNQKLMAKQTYHILGHPPVTPLESYIGSKSINADNGLHWALITAIPLDEYDNRIPDGTPAKFELRRPNGQLETHNNVTVGGIAFLKIPSGVALGKTIVGVQIGQATSKEKEMEEMPSFPTNLSIYAEKIYEYADSRQFFSVKTNVIKDQFGHIVADGTLVKIKVVSPDNKISVLSAYTLDGIAEIKIQNPNLKGNLQISAAIFGSVESNTLSIPFKSILNDFKIRYNAKSNTLLLGPMVANLNQNVSDGSEINVSIEPTGLSKLGIVKSGFAKVDLSDLKPGIYHIELNFGGISKHIKIKI